MNTIFVSIIVPVYKVPLDYLRECFDSLLAQTMSECEFIIVSDGAPESECAICKEYAKKDSRFKFFSIEHAGVSAARNYGINQAVGEYITFVDADDRIAPNTCNETFSFAKSNNNDIVFWDCIFEKTSQSQSTNFYEKSINLLNNSQQKKLLSNCIHAQSQKLLIPAITVCKLFKTSFMIENKLHYDTQLISGEDRVFNYKAYTSTNKISYFKKSFYHYRIHNQSFTQAFQPNYLTNSLNYIKELDKQSNGIFFSEIGNELFEAYSASWYSDYLHKENKQSFIKKYLSLINILKSEFFTSKIKYASYHNQCSTYKIELWLLKHSIAFPIWIKALKREILDKTKN